MTSTSTIEHSKHTAYAADFVPAGAPPSRRIAQGGQAGKRAPRAARRAVANVQACRDSLVTFDLETVTANVTKETKFVTGYDVRYGSRFGFRYDF